LSLPLVITKTVRERLAKLEEANAKEIAVCLSRLQALEDPRALEAATVEWHRLKARSKRVTYANVIRVIIEHGIKEYERGTPSDQLNRFDKADLPARGRPSAGDERGT
jgi:hypothetical protein